VRQRINVRGGPGSGKSTFAADLARRLGLVYIELDLLHHGPNWSQPTNEDFRARVRKAMEGASDGWVVDGNYESKLSDLVVAEADTIVWLDLPLSIKWSRLWRRTVHRIRNEVELWNGNRETWRGAFADRDSVLLWLFRSHIGHRRRWPKQFDGDKRLVRLRSEDEARRWLEAQRGGGAVS
jgi:adenylate kinase family enzyme